MINIKHFITDRKLQRAPWVPVFLYSVLVYIKAAPTLLISKQVFCSILGAKNNLSLLSPTIYLCKYSFKIWIWIRTH